MNSDCEDITEEAYSTQVQHLSDALVLTVVVCTFNRAALLASCLQSLVEQTADKGTFEVLVVDNNSTDATAVAAAAFADAIRHFRVVSEPQQGLSNARNRGWKQARGSYVAYLDDDAVANHDWICCICSFVEKWPHISIFGGPYDAFSLVPRPRWFPPEYGCLDLGTVERPIKLGQEWITGSNMIFRKDLFQNLGGFDPMLGMQGARVAYGEEINLLLFMHEKGVQIYYAPSVRVRHLIRADKMQLRYLLRSAYLVGRNHSLTFNCKRSLAELLISLTVALEKACFSLVTTGRVPFKRKLYYALSPLFGEIGALAEYFSSLLTLSNRELFGDRNA